MSDFHYFDIKLKLRDPDQVVLTPALFRSCLVDAMESFFCQEKPVLDIVKFCALQQRIIFRVPEEFYEMARISIPLIGHYQQNPCHFEVLETSKTLLDFEKLIEQEEEDQLLLEKRFKYK